MAGATGYFDLTDGSYGITFRVHYSEAFDEATGKTTVSITKLQVKCSAYSGFVHYLDGKITIGGKTAVTMSSHYGTHPVSVNKEDTWYGVGGTLGEVSGIVRTNDGTDSVSISVSLKAYSTTSTGAMWSISGSKNASLVKAYPLTISSVTGASVTVNRTSSTQGMVGALTSGAFVYAGDVLTISFSADAGYNLGIHTVNGKTFTSGDIHTVSASVAVAVSAILKTFKLTISAGTGTTITVLKSGAALANGATITYGDKLTVNFELNAGYILQSHTVNDADFTSGDVHEVTGNVTVAATAIPGSYKLTIQQGEGTIITVTKDGQILASGDAVGYRDQVMILFETEEGYDLQTHTANGEELGSRESYTVTEDVTVAATASLKQFVLSVSVNEGGTVTVERTASAGGGIGQLQNGEVLYYGDQLTVSFADDETHDVAEASQNGVAIQSGTELTVQNDVSVIVVFMLSGGVVFINEGDTDGKYYVFIANGSSWNLYEAYRDTGTEWILCDE